MMCKRLCIDFRILFAQFLMLTTSVPSCIEGDQQLQQTLCQHFTPKNCMLDIKTIQSAVHEKPTWRRELCSVLALHVSVAYLLARFGCVRACN